MTPTARYWLGWTIAGALALIPIDLLLYLIWRK